MSTDFNTRKTEDSTNVWLTPRWLLDLLGVFDMDPCAATVRPWDCAKANYTEANDGLLQEWRGRVWLNPPYGAEAVPFMRKMSEYRGPGLALVFVRTDTRWFHKYILDTARWMFFLKGRVRFCRPDGTPGNAPNAPSALVAWNDEEWPLLRSLQGLGIGRLVEIDN